MSADDLPVWSAAAEAERLPDARERVVELLTRQFAADRIGQADLEARLERVYASATLSELHAIVADLTEPLPAAMPPADATAVRHIDALFSGQELRMTEVVPRRLELRSRLGYLDLDLTHAAFEPGLTAIDVRAIMGYARVLLPPGVRVECHGDAVAGYFSLQGVSRAGGADAPSVVRITGRATFGYAEVFVASGGAPRLRGRRGRDSLDE